MRSSKDVPEEAFIGILQVLQGEEVAIITSVIINKEPVSFYGVLIDVDRYFYYLGDHTGQITQFIQREQVLGVLDVAAIQAGEAYDAPPPGVLN